MLFDSIDALRDEGWSWGEMDCCQFVRRVLKDAHGIDFAPDAPEYSSAREALRIVRESGGMERFISQYLGDPVPRNQVRRGDVCLAEFPAGMAIGICSGQNAAFASMDGVIFVPMEQVLKGWNI